MGKTPNAIPYTETYKESCFQAWYSAGCPGKIPQVRDIIPEDEYGRKPSHRLLRLWRDEMGWDWRRDVLDAKAIEIVDDELVQQRVLMLREQAAKGRNLQKMGMEYLEEVGFDSSSSAVSAVIRGAELERSSRGLSDTLLKLSKMSDEQLTREVASLLERASPGDVDFEEIQEITKEESDDSAAEK